MVQGLLGSGPKPKNHYKLLTPRPLNPKGLGRECAMAPKTASKQPFLEARRVPFDALTEEAAVGTTRTRTDGDVLIDEKSMSEVAANPADAFATIAFGTYTADDDVFSSSTFGITKRTASVFGPTEAVEFLDKAGSGEAVIANWELASRILGGTTTGSFIAALAMTFAAHCGHGANGVVSFVARCCCCL